MSQEYHLSSVPGFMSLLHSSLEAPIQAGLLNLSKMDCRTTHMPYKVVRYDKPMLCQDQITTYGLCRSVIANSANQVVAFAPPKSVPADTFIQKYPLTDNHNIRMEEFVEGTMINVFFDHTVGISGAWEIATRNTVGATSTFYKHSGSKSFRDMFMEAAAMCHLNIHKLDSRLCYSFVLQHPDNRIVVPFQKPTLYLVAVYEIKQTSQDVIVKRYDAHEYKHYFSNDLSSSVQFPKQYTCQSYTELIETYGSMNTSYDIVGAMMYNETTGERAKIRNPVYEQVRALKGNQPKLQYQYLCLRHEGKVKDYLVYYPENKKEFSAFRDQVHLFTDTLYNNYVACYIRKEKALNQYPQQFRTHMYTIHQHYMNELREKKGFITNTFVQNYVNQLHPSLLMYCLNYHMRKRYVDTLKHCELDL